MYIVLVSLMQIKGILYFFASEIFVEFHYPQNKQKSMFDFISSPG